MDFALTNSQARQFLLYKHGLLGQYRFKGKAGALEYVEKAGCIQFDPIDVCGKNPELVLQSRVKGFTKQMLYELLYIDRQLIDYFDKNLAIMPMKDWKYFQRYREHYINEGRSRAEVDAVSEEVKAFIRENGPTSSADIGSKVDEAFSATRKKTTDKVNWYWSDTKLSRAALETLYFRGELVVHHKKGAIKYYELAENCLSTDMITTPEPYPDDFEHMKWRVLRRISAVGLLWNRPSDAWLNIWGLKASLRNKIFEELEAEGSIICVTVENMKDKLYCHVNDRKLMEYILSNPKLTERCELLAPLDNLLWDRRLIAALFDFDYKWEIYTPAIQRKYGYYVLPVLYGDRLIARTETVNERKTGTMIVKNIWFEDDVKRSKKFEQALTKCFERFAVFNDCVKVEYQHDYVDSKRINL